MIILLLFFEKRLIVNDDLQEAYEKLRRILLVERTKRLREHKLEDHVRRLLGEL